MTPDSFVKPGESPSSSRRLPGGFSVGRERGVRLAAVWAGWRAADKQDGISRPTRPSAHPRGAGPSAGKPRAPAAPRTRPCARTRRGSAESLALEARLGALRASRHTWAFRLWGPRVGGRERKRLRAPRPRPCSRALAPGASPESSCFPRSSPPPRPRGSFWRACRLPAHGV